MRLLLSGHWVRDDADPDAIAAALAPFKAQGTDGYALLYAEGDAAAQKTFDMLKAKHDSHTAAEDA